MIDLILIDKSQIPTQIIQVDIPKGLDCSTNFVVKHLALILKAFFIYYTGF